MHATSLFTIIALVLSIALSGALSGCASLFSDRKCLASDQTYGSNEFVANVTSYRGESSSAKSLVLMPPTGGTNYIDRSYARQFCSAGYDVYVMNSWTADTGKSTDLEIHQGFYSRMLIAVELVTSEIKSPFIGILGTSLGGLYSAVASSRLNRLNAVFTIVAGAPIMEVVVKSDQQAMRNLSLSRSRKYGYSNDEEYLSGLSKTFALEPMAQGIRHEKQDFGMVVAENDTTVPTAMQYRLRDFWKPRKVIILSSTHFWAIVKTWFFYDDDIISFFDESANQVLKSDSQ